MAPFGGTQAPFKLPAAEPKSAHHRKQLAMMPTEARSLWILKSHQVLAPLPSVSGFGCFYDFCTLEAKQSLQAHALLVALQISMCIKDETAETGWFFPPSLHHPFCIFCEVLFLNTMTASGEEHIPFLNQ